MGDSYVEILIKREPKPYAPLVKGVFLFLTVLSFVIGALWHHLLFIVFGILLAVASYFVFLELDVEFEYLFVNGELTIDKILGKSSRKNCLTVLLENVEMAAPASSWHLGDYKNQKCTVLDFSSGKKSDQLYALFYRSDKGMNKLLFEPNQKMTEAMHQMAPRKIFFD